MAACATMYTPNRDFSFCSCRTLLSLKAYPAKTRCQILFNEFLINDLTRGGGNKNGGDSRYVILAEACLPAGRQGSRLIFLCRDRAFRAGGSIRVPDTVFYPTEPRGTLTFQA